MKKLIYLPLLLISLTFGINKVNALGSYYLEHYYDDYAFLTTIDSNIVDNLVNYYNTNFSSSYDHYVIDYSSLTNELSLYAVNETNMYLDSNGTFLLIHSSAADGRSYYYDFDDNQYHTYNYLSNSFPKLIYSTDTPFTFADSSNCGAWNPSNNCYDIAQLPSWSDLTLDVSYPLINLEKGDEIPTYVSLTNGQPSADFTRVDMSDYEYIVLSLRNYDTTTFNTTIYSLGRLCFTPVYNYGMTQKSELITGYQNQACTEYYNNLTPVMITIIQADLDNHAVYYIKRYENETNVLEIPTSIFDITYITETNENDPQVVIGGRSYPITKFNDLTDTANISSEEGYVSGQVCALGDVNCYYSAKDMDFNDVFTQPLKTLKSLWSSISLIFNIVSEFISLLPPVLQSFLFTAFMICVVIGILKLVLGAV